MTVNGRPQEHEVEPRTLLVHYLREQVGKVGTVVGCDTSNCGACTVHLDGAPVRSCVFPVSAAEGKRITTIEGLANKGVLTAAQQAWIDHDVPQCGYCQSGQVMSATALLRVNKKPSDADIDNAMSGNICRCGTYQRIRAAIKDAAKTLA